MNKPVIICVDDEKIVLTSLKSQLQHHFGTQYQIELAESAEETLELIAELKAEHQPVPLIIADYVMPGMYGDELLVRVKEQLPDTLSIMLTGQATADAVGEAVNRAGLFRYISKPWHEKDFLLTVCTALDSYHQKLEIQRRSRFRQVLASVISLALRGGDLSQQLHHALDSLLAIPELGAASAAVYLLDPSADQLQLQISAGKQGAFHHHLPLSGDQHGCQFFQPLTYQGHTMGALGIINNDGVQTCPELPELLTSYGEALAGIIQLKQYHEALERHNAELEETVKRRTQDLQTALDQQAKLNNILLEANRKLDFYASMDSLTSLYNRRFFMKLANSEVERAKRYQHPVTFMMLDLDHFKNINDQYGHLAGDHVLERISHLLTDESREADIIGRLGGEEFAILSPESTVQQASLMAERIRDRILQESFAYEGQNIHVTVSIGISEVDVNEEHIESAMNRADKALYKSKGTGRNLVSIAGL
ncbi:MAG: diguanylate cyclase [Pseudomonadota bacterium]|nr:diguanylate cyclase [Pseudomonadota bacterium]